MTKTNNEKIAALKQGWYVWLFPLIAVLISGWLFSGYLKEQGSTIKINFEDASSIQIERTRVRFHGVTIGKVKRISISEDNKGAVVYVTLQRDAEHFAVEGTKFWVVSPKVGFQGVSGLETLFQGTYIAAQPGPPEGESKEEFKGLLSDSSESLDNTVIYFLETSTVESISVGDSVTFRGLIIGSVTNVSLSKTAQSALVQINVHNKYVKLIRTNTVFWRKVGIQANLGLFSSVVKMNSLDSILHGGIEFFTPDAAGAVAKSHTKFNLIAGPPKGWEKWNPKLEL